MYIIYAGPISSGVQNLDIRYETHRHHNKKERNFCRIRFSTLPPESSGLVDFHVRLNP